MWTAICQFYWTLCLSPLRICYRPRSSTCKSRSCSFRANLSSTSAFAIKNARPTSTRTLRLLNSRSSSVSRFSAPQLSLFFSGVYASSYSGVSLTCASLSVQDLLGKAFPIGEMLMCDAVVDCTEIDVEAGKLVSNRLRDMV